MKQKKIPLRTCVVTREKLPKHELIRVVRDKDGIVSIDLTGKANGRGAYIKKSSTAIEQAKKRNSLSRHLEVTIPDEIFDELLKVAEANE